MRPAWQAAPRPRNPRNTAAHLTHTSSWDVTQPPRRARSPSSRRGPWAQTGGVAVSPEPWIPGPAPGVRPAPIRSPRGPGCVPAGDRRFGARPRSGPETTGLLSHRTCGRCTTYRFQHPPPSLPDPGLHVSPPLPQRGGEAGRTPRAVVFSTLIPAHTRACEPRESRAEHPAAPGGSGSERFEETRGCSRCANRHGVSSKN